MDYNAISTLISALISGMIAFFVCKWQIIRQKQSSEKARLNEQLFNILKIQIKYPYLEHINFTNAWTREKANEELDYQRYDSYCCMLFNFMEQIYELYEGNINEIENFFTVEEEVKIHKIWWHNPLNPRDNIDGYDKKYRIYINSVIDRVTK